MLRVARLEVSDDTLGTIPDLVANRLEEVGVTDAVIRAPEPGGALDRLDSCPNAVVLRLFPPPLGEGGGLPAEWIDIAGEWVLGDLAPSDSVPLRLLAVEFDVKVANAPAILHQASGAQAWCDVVNGNIEERIRTASITFGKAPHVALAAGGPACDSQALLARFELLTEVAREYAGGVVLRVPRHRDHLRRHRARAPEHRLARPGRRLAQPGGGSPQRRPRPRRLPVPDPRQGPPGPARLRHPRRRRAADRRSDRRGQGGGADRRAGRLAADLRQPPGRPRAGLGAAGPAAGQRPAGGRSAGRPARGGRGRRAGPGRRARDAGGGRAAEPRGHHPRDAPPRAPWPAPHAARAGGVAGPRTAQRRAGERLPRARHLRPLVRVGPRRPAAPDPQGPRPPPHRHRVPGGPACEQRSAAPVGRRLRSRVAGHRLAHPRAGRVVAEAGGPHRGRRPARVDRADQQPPRPRARGRRARLGDHDRGSPHRPHRLDRRRGAGRRRLARRPGARGRRGSERPSPPGGSRRRRPRRWACPPSSPTPPTSG